MATAITAALAKLLERDAYLLRVDANERSIAHRLALYVEEQFDGWDVDCEYNRDGHEPKEIAFGAEGEGEHGSRVFPDVIVHRRGTGDNLLVVELKKTSNLESDDRDMEKLRRYCNQLGYRHGVFARLVVRPDQPDIGRAEFVYGEP